MTSRQERVLMRAFENLDVEDGFANARDIVHALDYLDEWGV